MSSESTAPGAGRPWPAERLAWTLGILCLAAYAAIRFAGAAGARRELSRFDELRSSTASHLEAAQPDLTLWAPGRIQAWRDSGKQPAGLPLAVLRIPKIRLEVAVLEGTDDGTLNRAVGRIAGTSLPGARGNLGIAGHRDGFFRGLKDIGLGDAIDLETKTGHQAYVVEEIRIVAPEDVSVLAGTPDQTITLVTCYPFYFIGSAPRRYIVRAVQRSVALHSS
jgi:sortase A